MGRKEAVMREKGPKLTTKKLYLYMYHVKCRTKMLNQTQSDKEKKPEEKSEKAPPVNGVVYASLKEAIQKRLFDIVLNWDLFYPAYALGCSLIPSSTLPILPTSFQNVEEYIQFYASFVLQEVQAQAFKMLSR